MGIHRLLHSSFCFLNIITATTRQLIRTARTLEASLRVNVGTDKGKWVKYWERLGCWISPRYDPFSLGARFEIYEPFISLIFQPFFSGRGQPWITETSDTESAETAVHLYWEILTED